MIHQMGLCPLSIPYRVLEFELDHSFPGSGSESNCERDRVTVDSRYLSGIKYAAARAADVTFAFIVALIPSKGTKRPRIYLLPILFHVYSLKRSMNGKKHLFVSPYIDKYRIHEI